jgi:predicted TIM-barrel fold metal-dependent hydrolase
VLNDLQLRRECVQAYNSWAAEQVVGFQDRQIPVCFVDLDDVDWAIAEVTRMREHGSRGVMIPGGPIAGKSLAHPDFERFWSACEDLGVAVIFHLSISGRTRLDPGWSNAGRDWRGSTLLYTTQIHQLPEVALGAMVLGGVLERHPRLIVMSQEIDIGWVPAWVSKMDSVTSTGFFRRHYTLPLKPSEYVQRQVFVSGLAPSDTLIGVFENTPLDTIVFASDWPHPEGGPIETASETWLKQLSGAPQHRIDSFLGDAIANAMQL